MNGKKSRVVRGNRYFREYLFQLPDLHIRNINFKEVEVKPKVVWPPAAEPAHKGAK